MGFKQIRVLSEFEDRPRLRAEKDYRIKKGKEVKEILVEVEERCLFSGMQHPKRIGKVPLERRTRHRLVCSLLLKNDKHSDHKEKGG